LFDPHSYLLPTYCFWSNLFLYFSVSKITGKYSKLWSLYFQHVDSGSQMMPIDFGSQDHFYRVSAHWWAILLGSYHNSVRLSVRSGILWKRILL